MLALALVHAAATFMLTGLIWFVQVVHYPLFAAVGPERLSAYEHRHVRRTGPVVLPLMLTELTTAIALVVVRRDGVGPAAWLGLVLLGVIWASTFLLQVPCHRRLERGFDAEVIRRLVQTNWIRTAAWTVRSGVALVIIVIVTARATV